MSNANRQLTWLRRLRDLSHSLAAERDPKTIQEKILDAAVDLTDAERCFLVRLEPTEGPKPKIQVTVARGFEHNTLQASAGKVSRSVVNRVLEEDRGVVTSQEEDSDLKDVTSVIQRRVRSIIAVPLRLRGSTIGVLYLDHRFDHQAFTVDDLPCLDAFADQAALALETAELHADRDAHEKALGAAMRELRALEQRSERPSLPKSKDAPRFGALVGHSPGMRKVYERVERAARFAAPVLITGESGTGKERVAREIHRRGEHADAPFVSVSCAAVPEGLLASELFGHRQGAFTSASEERKGLFLEAGAGTIFLDEVADMSAAMQANLLRVLQERVIRPVGATELVPLACRVIVASQHDLRDLVAARRFREDLFYRLDVLRIVLPPLRERLEDIPHLLAEFLLRGGLARPELGPGLLAQVLDHDWPGNVRQLENEAMRLASLGRKDLYVRDLSPETRGADLGGGGKTLGEVEKEMLLAALRETKGNKSEAARKLGIARSSLYGILKKHGLE